jgi:hypothetical protein
MPETLELRCKGARPYFSEHQCVAEEVYVRDDGCRCQPCMALQFLVEGDLKSFYKIFEGKVIYETK